MGKFINIPLPIVDATAELPAKVVVTNSETTTAAVAGKLTDTGGTANFTTNVMVGDIIFPTGSASSVYSTVTAIDSDSVLSISGSGTTLLEASGQAYLIYTSASAHSLTWSSGLFLSDVRAGDVILNQTTGLIGRVTKVVSNTQLSIDRILFNDNATDVAIIISQSGYGGRLVSLENIASIDNGTGSSTTPIKVRYKTVTAGNDILTIDTEESQADFSWSNAFKKTMVEALESNWKDVIVDMPLIASPAGATAPILYATVVTLA